MTKPRVVGTRTGAWLPAMGLGTWRMGLDTRLRAAEADALRLGIDLGLTLVDTAEMYADGGAEEVVGLALEGRRDEVFVVSKVLPENASRRGTVLAAERSLRRMKIETIDLFLLHWAGRHPLEGTLAAFAELAEAGKIRHCGVSNFDLAEMEEAERLPGGGRVCANQVLYNLAHRSVEGRLLPWCSGRGVALMAYTPLDQGRLLRRRVLRAVAERRGVTPAQVALAWTLAREGIVTIPKAARPEHVRENAAALGLTLAPEDLDDLERANPPPDRDAPLEFL